MKVKIFLIVATLTLILSLVGSSMAARLPVVSSDTNNWGTILNGFLGAVHTPNGTLKKGINASFYNLNATNIIVDTINGTSIALFNKSISLAGYIKTESDPIASTYVINRTLDEIGDEANKSLLPHIKSSIYNSNLTVKAWIQLQLFNGTLVINNSAKLQKISNSTHSDTSSSIDWTQIANIPAGFADDTDDTGGGGSGVFMVNSKYITPNESSTSGINSLNITNIFINGTEFHKYLTVRYRGLYVNFTTDNRTNNSMKSHVDAQDTLVRASINNNITRILNNGSVLVNGTGKVQVVTNSSFARTCSIYNSAYLYIRVADFNLNNISNKTSWANILNKPAVSNFQLSNVSNKTSWANVLDKPKLVVNESGATLNNLTVTGYAGIEKNLTVNGLHIDKINATHWRLWG